MKTLITLSFLFCITLATAQVGINTTTPNAQLEIKSSNETTPTNTDGIIIPKINAFPATNPTALQQGMMVYLTTAVSANVPGFYYWDNTGTPAWKPVAGTGGTLDNAYDFGGAGLGKTITADAGAVLINGTDGLLSTGTFGSGVLAPDGAGTRMLWNPAKAAFRAGRVLGTEWDNINIGLYSTSFGNSNRASGFNSTAFGLSSVASGGTSTAMGNNSIASGDFSTAIGGSTASGEEAIAIGKSTVALAKSSMAFGKNNFARSYGETTFGIGSTAYNPSLNGSSDFTIANATDRLLVVGNAIDANNNDNVDPAERSDALVILKNGNTGIGISNPTERVHIQGNLRLENGTQAAGRVLTSDATGLATWSIPAVGSGGTLDQAYDFGGAGLGKTITADAGAVLINGSDGFVSTGVSPVPISGVNYALTGATVPTGPGTRMIWNPRKSAFRAGSAYGTQWEDVNVGIDSFAFGLNNTASGAFQATAFGVNTIASGWRSTSFGQSTIASGEHSTAFGFQSEASGDNSLAFGKNTTSNGENSTSFGLNTIASGKNATAFGSQNTTPSYGETTIGIGATEYTTSLNGATQFRTANATDRLFVVGNAIDANNNNNVDFAERSDALIILKSGLTILPSTTNTMIDAASGKAVVTKEWAQANAGGGTLDKAYDFGGAGLGKTITADAGAVLIDGTDGFVSIGTTGIGAVAPTGIGTRMVWNPRKAAFRAGRAFASEWDDINIGLHSTAFGYSTIANALQATAFGLYTIASGPISTAFGRFSTASGDLSTAFGYFNDAPSYGETVFGIGATNYTTSVNGASQFRTANASDRLLAVGNAIDADNDSFIDTAERSDALVILKNGNTGIGTSTPARRLHVATGVSGGTPNAASDFVLESNGPVYQHFLAPSTAETGLLFGSNVGSIRGGVLFNNVNESLLFRTGGNSSRMFITNVGDVGIGVAAPGGQFQLSLDEGRKPATSTWTIVSDQRLKNINGKYTKGLNEIIQLNPVRYNYKNTGTRNFEQEVLDSEFAGFIAQEVQPLFPEAVKTDDDGYLSFNMHSILVASINAFKELNDKNKSLETENDTLKKEVQSQKTLLQNIINRLEKLENK